MSKKNKKKILIIGTRRSGSTFIGKLLSVTTKAFSYVEEPLNPVMGIKKLDHIWYPFINDSYPKTSVKKDLLKILTLKRVKFKNSIVNVKTKKSYLNTTRIKVFIEIFKNESKESLIKRVLRLFLKSNHCFSYLKARFSFKNNIVFKDVFMSLSLSQVFKKNQTFAIFIFRDPLGFFYSIKRLNWTIQTTNFLKQENLITEHPWIKELPTEKKIDHIINEWIIINKILLKELESNKKIICVSHKRISLYPASQLEIILKKIEVNLALDNNKLIEFTKGSQNAESTKDVKRDSKSQLNSWVGKISIQDQEYILDRTKVLYEELVKHAI